MSFIDNLKNNLRVPQEKEREIINELEQHLEEETRTSQIQGKNSIIAQAIAEKDMGDPNTVAKSFNETHESINRLLLKLHAQHALMFFIVYGLICSTYSLAFVLYYAFGTYSVWNPDLAQIFPGSFFLAIPFFSVFLHSAKKIRARGFSLPEFRRIYLSLCKGIAIMNALLLVIFAFFDGKIRDFLIGRITFDHFMSLQYYPDEIRGMIVVIIFTSLLYSFLFLIAVLFTRISKNENGIIVKM